MLPNTWQFSVNIHMCGFRRIIISKDSSSMSFFPVKLKISSLLLMRRYNSRTYFALYLFLFLNCLRRIGEKKKKTGITGYYVIVIIMTTTII